MCKLFQSLSSAILFFTLSFPALAQEIGIAEVIPNTETDKMTASGTKYNPQVPTAMHKIHAMGTKLKVTRIDDNSRRWTIVSVNDRGPYTSGHIIALSKVAALRLGMKEQSTAQVLVEVIAPGYSSQSVAAKKPAQPAQTSKAGTPSSGNVKEPAQAAATVSGTPSPGMNSQLTAKGSATKTTSSGIKGANQGFAKNGLYGINTPNPQQKGYGVQIMALTNPEQLLEQLTKLQEKWFSKILVSVEPGGQKAVQVYKIILGPFDSEQEARTYAGNLRKNYKMEGFIVNLADKKY